MYALIYIVTTDSFSERGVALFSRVTKCFLGKKNKVVNLSGVCHKDVFGANTDLILIFI